MKINLKRKKYIKYNDWLDKWLLLQKNQIKESTYSTYKTHIKNHIKPYFKDVYISKMTNKEIQEFINDKIMYGRLDHQGGLSVKTVKELVNIIKLSLKSAINNHIIESIIFEFKYPKHNHIIQMLDHNECKQLIKYLKQERTFISIGILLILCTGIRIGELCALTNQDINLNKQELYIDKTLQRIYDIDNHSSKIIISSTKTHHSTRIIPIPNTLLPYLEIENNNYYFLTQNEKYIEPRTLRYHFKKILKKVNLSNVTVHSLRHYFASQCIELGFDYNCLSEILGHSSPSTTMNLYVHSKKEYKKTCMNKIVI